MGDVTNKGGHKRETKTRRVGEETNCQTEVPGGKTRSEIFKEFFPSEISHYKKKKGSRRIVPPRRREKKISSWGKGREGDDSETQTESIAK